MLAQSLILAFAASAIAAPFSPSYVVHEKRSAKFHGQTSRVPRDAIVPVRIGLTQSNLDKTYDYLMDVSDPSSSNYGKHWTSDEVNSIYAPSEQTTKAVKEWLLSAGVDAASIFTSRNQGWLAVNMPVTQAESLFKTEYFEHEGDDGTVRLGCDSYQLPSHLSQHVDFIKPGVSLSAPLKKTVKNRKSGRGASTNKARHGAGHASGAAWDNPSSDLANCGSSITPACIKALYDIPDANISAAEDPANALGIFESGDVYSQEDLDLYFGAHIPNVPKGTHPTPVLIDGAKAPVGVHSKENGGESDIDLGMAYALIYPQSVTLYQEPGSFNLDATTDVEKILDDRSFLTPFLDAVDGSNCTPLDSQSGLQCGVYNLTRVVSISYGAPELDLGEGTIIAQQRACNEIAKLGLQGTTVVVSSGDYGVATNPQPKANGCAAVTSSGVDAFAANGTVFSPSFPATCPYVLAVGATQLQAGQSVDNAESVMNPGHDVVHADGVGSTFTSGGGFANYFDTPSYQSSAVNSYFEQYDPGYPHYHAINGTGIAAHGGKYNRGGRGIPDVAANGAWFSAFNKGHSTSFFGTSLAAPLWASLITLINEARCAAGKGPVGFVNPALYANPSAFHDITVGNNPGCNTDGFPAVPGWEPSTGLGTPDFPSLLQVFSSLP